MKTIIASLSELDTVTQYLADVIPPNAIISLKGDLASGKTTLTKAITTQRGYQAEVTSPTFSLQHCYANDFFHYDLYRINYEQFMDMGLFEEFDREGWHVVEWADDELKSFLLAAGYGLYEVMITPKDSHRIYQIKRLDAQT